MKNLKFLVFFGLSFVLTSCEHLIGDNSFNNSISGDLAIEVSTNQRVVEPNKEIAILCKINNVSNCADCDTPATTGIVKFAYSSTHSSKATDYDELETKVPFDIDPTVPGGSQTDEMPAVFPTVGYYLVTFVCNHNRDITEEDYSNNSDAIIVEVKE